MGLGKLPDQVQSANPDGTLHTLDAGTVLEHEGYQGKVPITDQGGHPLDQRARAHLRTASQEHSMNTVLKRLRFVVALFFAVALVACASGPKVALHGFSFDGIGDANKWRNQIEILEYNYGGSQRAFRNSLENPNSQGLYKNDTGLPPTHYVAGFLPVGDFLYVKWRIKQTGEVLEERVDLKDRLPQQMDHHTLTFSIDERQLHVYVVTPFPRYDPKLPKTERIADVYPPTHLTWQSKQLWTYEIYPKLEPYPEPTNLTPAQKQRCLKGETLCNLDKPKK
jgi:hypothetical protein